MDKLDLVTDEIEVYIPGQTVETYYKEKYPPII